MQTLKNNMKNKGFFFLVSILFLFSLAFVSAQTFQEFGEINIEYAKLETYAINQDIHFHFHTTNLTQSLSNESINCVFSLVNSSGFPIIEEQDLYFHEGSDNEWGITILKGNFTKVGKLSYTMECDSPIQTGMVSLGFQITKTGLPLDPSESLVYFILAFGVLLLFTLSFYFMISTPYGNETNEKGAVIKITKLKYVKLALILLTWVLFTWFLNILIGLSDNFVSLTMYYGFFGFIFQIMNSLAFPLGIVILVISIFEIIRDANIMGNIKKFGSAYK